jgi:hypothetical protein
MTLGLHTCSLNPHGIGQAWAGFTCAWHRQFSTFQLLDLLVDLDLGEGSPTIFEMEIDAIRRSVCYCREIVGIRRSGG